MLLSEVPCPLAATRFWPYTGSLVAAGGHFLMATNTDRDCRLFHCPVMQGRCEKGTIYRLHSRLDYVKVSGTHLGNVNRE